MNILLASPSRSPKQCPPPTRQDLARSPGLNGGASPHSQPLPGEAVQRSPNPQGRTAQRLPGSGVGLSAGWSAVWRPRRPSPSAPTAPSRRRLTGGGRSSALTRPGDAATWKPRLSKRARGALRCLCSKAAHSPAPTLFFPPPGPPAASSLPPPLQPLAPAGCHSSSYFLPVPRPVQQQEVVLTLYRSPWNSLILPRGSGAAQEVAALLASSSFYPESDYFASSPPNWQYLNTEASF